jgi:hypothetical protein
MAATRYMKVRPPALPTAIDEPAFETPREPLPNDIQTSVLVFPSRAPSEPLSPSAPETRRGSTTASIPGSLISSVEGRSPRSLSPSGSWDETIDSDPRTRLGGAHVSQPLTHDRVAQIEAARNTAWHTRATDHTYASGPDIVDDSDVELWEWTASSPAGSQPVSLLQGRRPLSPRRAASVIGNHYELASPEFHFSASDQDGSADEPDFESMFLITLKSRRHAHLPPRHTRNFELEQVYGASSFFSPKILPLPFEPILRLFFELDQSTLSLIKQQNVRPHPDNPCNLPPTNLFPVRVTPDDEKTPDDIAEIIRRPPLLLGSHSLFADETHVSVSMIRRGLEIQTNAEVPDTDTQASSFTRELLIGVTRLPIMLARAVLRI